MSLNSKQKNKAVFVFETPYAEQIFESVRPEDDDMGRSCSKVSLKDENSIALTVEADDVSALRAALNTWLRLIIIAEEMQEVIKDE
ncbi:hypothetical protein L1994_03645 [Methanomicrobium antiquum]|uniref:KEOPS complex Pcc1-like subunit n=1 Tax=Methanomicrobium antiquum TaxID=487686 RepID=A0AAF0FW99_9EURY|nr:KEOPS complex subunit Pcc1 [Methanomicrobium antiquum]MDD3976550.1 KEOPS complex subunit Pcc1 [Methanomicrobium sp.]WFN37493.1 hypothetical protein L1994_03645 [Methanomicrobium antiquum]